MIWIIKWRIRPHVPLNPALQFMAGVAPNFLGAILIPFALYWLYTHPLFFKGSLMRFEFFSDTRIVCIIGFSLAVLNEYLQRIPVFGREFDYFDIAFSAVGLILWYYFFTALQRAIIYGG